jgi:hypothetical protein
MMIGSRVPLHLTPLLILVIIFANLSVAVHAVSLPDLMVDNVWLEEIDRK